MLRLSFSVAAENKGEVEFLRLAGAVAGATSQQLADLRRCGADADQVVVDLTDCRLLDGAALQTLLDVSHRVPMTVICPHECLSGVLHFVGLAELAQIVSSIDFEESPGSAVLRR